MRKYNWTLLLIITLTKSISAQESEYYKILSELLPDKKITLIKKTNNSYLKSVDAVLKYLNYDEYIYSGSTKLDQSGWKQKIVPDTNYIINELELPKLKWKRKYIEKKNLKFKRKNGLLSIFKRLFNLDKNVKNTIYSVSRPIFINRENDIAIVYYQIYNGPENGGGGVRLFIKTDDNWKQIGNRMIWIS